jgi:hypothetical protein
MRFRAERSLFQCLSWRFGGTQKAAFKASGPRAEYESMNAYSASEICFAVRVAGDCPDVSDFRINLDNFLWRRERDSNPR